MTTYRRGVWIILGVIGLIVLSLGGIFLDAWLGAGSAVERERARVKDGLAAIRAERVYRPVFFEPAEDGNSWELLTLGLKPFDALSEKEGQAFPSLQSDDESPPPSDQDIAEAVAKVEPHFEVLKQALRRRWVEPDYPYEESFAMKMPLMSLSIKGCRILGDRASSKHESGESGAAADLFVIGWGVADRIAVKGTLVNELVRIVCSEIMADRLRKLLAGHRFGADELARLDRALATVEAVRPSLLECLRREELIWGHGLVAMVQDGKSDGLLPDLDPFHRFTIRFQVAEYFDIIAGFLRDVESALKLPIQEGVKRLETVVRDVVKQHPNLIIALIIPQMARCLKNHAREVRNVSLARLAVAIARHREEKGTNPKALIDLVPKYLPSIPTDATLDRPFGYLTKDEGAVVYAWGEDGDDDGGRPVAEDEEDFEGAEGDLVWSVKRAK